MKTKKKAKNKRKSMQLYMHPIKIYESIRRMFIRKSWHLRKIENLSASKWENDLGQQCLMKLAQLDLKNGFHDKKSTPREGL